MADPMMVRRTSLQEAKALKKKGDLHEAIKCLLVSKADAQDGTRMDGNSLCAEMLKVLADDPHAALKVGKKESEAAVKKAYHKMALKYHPDKLKAGGELFQVVQAAYKVLTDISARMSFERNQARQQKQKSKAPKPAAQKSKPAYRPAPKRTNHEYNGRHKASDRQAYSKQAYGKQYDTKENAQPNFTPGNKVPPEKPFVTARTHDSITLEWNSMDSAVAYQLQWRPRGGQWAVAGKFVKSNTVRKRNLAPDTWYEFRVQAVNRKGPPWCTDYSTALLTRTSAASANGVSSPPPKQHRPAPPQNARGKSAGANPARRSLERRQRKEAKAAKARMQEREREAFAKRQREMEREAAARLKKQQKEKKDPMKDSWAWKRNLGRTDKSSRKQWTCDVCQRKNRVRHTSCKVCSAPRGYNRANLDGISGNVNKQAKKPPKEKKKYNNPFKIPKKEGKKKNDWNGEEWEFGWGPDDNVWQELLDEEGNVYYYNPSTCTSQWHPPTWTVHVDPATRAVYYQNNETGESQWEEPGGFIPIVQGQ